MATEGEPFGVLPGNEACVVLFLSLATQWRMTPAGLPQGLDYAAVEPAMRLAGLMPTPELFEGLRVMEAAALQAVHELSGTSSVPGKD